MKTSIHLMCLTSCGGLPIFIRQKGERDMMTFSNMASLNGVHMFLKSQNIELISTNMPDSTIVWKEFEETVILIVIANGVTKSVLERFLDTVFRTIILFIGIEEVRNIRNVDRLKRDIRTCIPIIDRLLECLDIGEKICIKTDFVYMTECILLAESHLLQACLDGYVDCLDSMYGCVLIHGCLAVATDGWWSLNAIERKLLISSISSENVYTVRDLPVFLPYKSPNVAFRLVSVTLINHVEILALCGPSPELSEIERLATQCWKNSIDVLRSSEQCYPRNIPSTISLDSGVLGFLLVNCEMEKFVLGRMPQCTNHRISNTHRLDILRTFYHQAVEIFLSSSIVNPNMENYLSSCDWKFFGGKETYWCSEYHKCHALRENNHILCILYASTVPTYTMRFISQKILSSLINDKQVVW